MTLSQKFGINKDNLALRQVFIALNRGDIRCLASLANWAHRVAPRLIKELYDHQFAFAPTRDFLQNCADQNGISLAALRDRLETSQQLYFRQIFLEAKNSGEFGTQYFDRRLDIGLRHNKINLPPKWYIGMYAEYLRLCKKYLRRSYWYRPFLRARAMEAINKIFNFDLQAVVDAFLLDLISSYGVDLEVVPIHSRAHDLTDYLGEFKHIIVNALSSVVITSHEVEYASHEVQSAAANMVEFVEDEAVNVKQALMTLESISDAANQSNQLAKQAGLLTTANGDAQKDCAVVAIDRIKKSSDQVSEIIGMIDSIAFQTKLLSLNAAVEAARAGEEGRGFAVVATEVKNLAERSAEASQEVKDLIDVSSISVQSGYILIHQLAELISQIVGNSEQQSQAVGGVTSAMRELTSAIDKSTNQANELSKTARTMTKQSNQLNKVVEALKLDSEFGDAFAQSNFAQDYLANLLGEDEDTDEQKTKGDDDNEAFGFF